MGTIEKNRVEDIETTRQKLAQMRDELRVKVHLAKAEVRDEWEELEKQIGRFEANAKLIQRESGEVARQMRDDLHGLAGEIRKGYERVRSSLS